MKFVVSFKHEHNTKSVSTGIVCVEADSAEEVRNELRDLAAEAIRVGSFTFQGYRLLTRDFCEFVTEQRQAYFESMALRLKRPAPAVFLVDGNNYRFMRVDVLPLDEWFEQHRKNADSTGE